MYKIGANRNFVFEPIKPNKAWGLWTLQGKRHKEHFEVNQAYLEAISS